MKFIHFGCWNEYGYMKGTSKEDPKLDQSGLTYVLEGIANHVKSNQIDFISIAGDNYYPHRKKEDPNTKVLDVGELMSGFDNLPQDIPKYVLFGNHDIEDNIEMTQVVEGSKYSSLQTTSKGMCKVLNLQQHIGSDSDSNYKIFNNPFHIVESQTIIIMIDTFVYEAKNYDCYKHIFDKFEHKDQNIKKLREFQTNYVLDLLEKNKCLNVIIIGHHPICWTKSKSQNRLNVGLGKFFESIGTALEDKARLYYLCADTHLYQNGIIKMGKLIINQHIVGTGGAHQDKYSFAGAFDPEYLFDFKGSKVSYQVINNYNRTYGFAEVEINSIPSVKDKSAIQDLITIRYIPVQVKYINLI